MNIMMFHLMPYADLDLEESEKYPSTWATLPNRLYDPKKGHLLYNRYLDELEYAEKLGFDGVCVNEHHQTAYGIMPSPIVTAAALSRRTTKAKIAILGSALPLRTHPLMVAEEHSMIDNITGGRLISGFVRGIGAEYHVFGTNPTISLERFQQAHDLIIRAWTEPGPFEYHSKHYHVEYVNVWPRPYQQPHPPVWTTAFGVAGVNPVADRGYRLCAGFNALSGKGIFDTYRRRYKELGRPAPDADRFGYLAVLAVGHTREQAFERAAKIRGYFESSAQTSEAYTNPAGYAPVEANVAAALRGQKTGVVRAPYYQRDGVTPVNNVSSPTEELIRSGAVFAGTPDEVYEQLRDFYQYIGGCGHLLPMMQGGWLSHEDTVDSMTLFAKDVLPRIAEFGSMQIEPQAA